MTPLVAEAQEILQRTPPKADARRPYGTDPNQFVDERMPGFIAGYPHVVIMIHGGYWRAKYSLDHTGHLCAALTKKGAITLNVEYRRIGQPGGGWPGTWDDVRAAIRFAVERYKLAAITVVGHSAGGHLALLAANEPGVRRVIALAPVADLRRAWELKLSQGVVGELLGVPPDARFAEASPIERLPNRTAVTVIHGRKDDIVPFAMGEAYAKKAGAKLIELPDAGHFELIDPLSAQWHIVEEAIFGLKP